ncbi:MAG: hypothetical protein IJE07_13040 [Clostridia bacterium]|nr:hypothetical protein [Clostridia bacterium]
MLYLMLAILSSSAVAVLMRLSGRHSKNGMTVLASNYLMCVIAAGVLAGWPLLPEVEGLGLTLSLGAVNGILYLGGFVLLQWCTKRSGVVLPATFQKLGVVIPTIAAITIFREQASWVRLLGVGVAVAAILVMQDRREGRQIRGLGGLIALLLVCGGCEVMSKVFASFGLEALDDHFLFYTFVVAFLLCVGLCIVRKQGVTLPDVLWGLAIGVPNYLCSFFVLGALMQGMEAVIVYPTYSAGTIIAVTLVGVLAFREKLNGRKIAALGMIMAALVLLNV